MNTKQTAEAILNGWAFIALFSWVWFLFMAVVLPLALFSVTNSLRGIHREMKRMNGTLKPAPETTWTPAAQPLPAAPAPSLGHQLLR